MSGKWHVASSLTKPTDNWPLQRGFDGFYGTIIGAGSFYDPNTLTRGNDNVEHEAHGRRLLLHRRDQRPGRRYIDAHANASMPASRSSCTSRTPRRTGRCTRTTRTSRSTRAGSTPAGTRCARRGSTSWSRRGILQPHWKLTDRDPTQPPWTEAEHKAVGWPALHGGLRRADRPHGPGHRPHRRGARAHRPARQHARHLPRRQRRLRRGHSGERDDRRAGRQADDRAVAHAQRRAGALRQRHPTACRARRTPTRATARRGRTCRTRRSACTSTGSTRAASRRR